MKLGSGLTYIVRNMVTGQEAQLHIHEMSEYKGQYIIQATVNRRGVRVFRGVVEEPARPAWFVVLPGENELRVQQLIDALGGCPLALVEAGVVFTPQGAVSGPANLLYIVNSDRNRFWPGSVSQAKDRAAKIIDLYIEWKEAGYVLPQWFREYAAATRTGQPGRSAS